MRKTKVMFMDAGDGISLLNCMQDMAVVLDESGSILELNPACERLGYTRGELLGSRFDALLPGEEKQMVEHMLSVVGEWKRHDFRATLLTRDEQPLDVHCAASLVEDGAGRMFALVLLRDITSLKRLEEALCEHELLSRLLESSKDGMVLLDDQSRIVRWSRALEDMTGFSCDEVLGRELWQVVDWLKPEDVEDSTDTHETFVESFTKLLSGDVSEFLKRPREARIKARDEKEHYIEVSASIVEQEEGRKVMHVARENGQVLSRVASRKRRMLLAVARDITERKRDELERIESERRYSQLAESLLVSIYILQDGLFAYANPRLCEHLGYELDELIGKPFTDIVHVEDMGSVEDTPFQLRCVKDESIEHELRIITREGKTRWMYASASTTDWKGREAVLGSMFDITERKLAGARLEELLSVQTVIASISEYLLIPKNIHDAIDECLNEMGKVLHVGEVCVFKFDGGQMSITNRYLVYGMPPLLHRLESIPVEEVSWVLKSLKQGMVYSSHIHGASEAERRLAFMLDASTAAVAPLYVRDRLWGILAVATDERAAPIPQTTHILKVVSELMSMRLEHHEGISELKRERDFVHNLLETTEALVVMLDCEGRITYFNSACEKATGYRSEDVLGKPLWEQFIPQEHVEGVKGVFSNLVEGNVASHYVNPWLTRGGGERIISWSNTVLAGDGDMKVLSIGIDITTLIEAEKALKERDALLHGVLSSLSQHIAVLDAHGNVIDTNDAWDRFALENESHDLARTGVGANYLEVCKKGATFDDTEKVYEGIRAVLEGTAQVFYIEYDCHSPEEERWFLMYITPLGGENGGAVVSHINITERKKNERLIERSLVLEKVISNISSRFVGARDMDDAINVSLAEMGKVSGASRVHLFLFNEDRTTISNTNEWCASGVSSQLQTLQNMPTAAFSWWMKHLEAGETINIKDVSELAQDAERELLERQGVKAVLVLPVYVSGGLSGFVGFDNTAQAGKWKKEDVPFLRLFSELLGTALERRKAESALEESERRHRELAEQLPDPLIEMDNELNITYVNRAALVAFGYTHEQVISGLNALAFIFPSKHAAIVGERDAVFQGALSGPTEYTLKRADGTEFTADINFAPIYRMNEVVGMRGVVRDITQRKQYELALLDAKQEAELYIDLMSHDINNLNTVAYGYLYLLVEDKATSEAHKKAMGRALLSIDGITRLISNVQRLREITHTERELVPMDIDAVVEASLTEIAGSHDNITIEHEHSGLKVLADPLLVEVMNNLLGNAIKHGGKGVHIWIRAEQADDSVRVLIEDNGKGVPDNLKPVIFNRLERGEGSVHGRGMGLYIVFTLVESYGGRVWVEDRVGGKLEQGARFVIELRKA